MPGYGDRIPQMLDMMELQLDDLDARLLKHFSTRFPRPDSLDICEYDVSAEEMETICSHERPYEVEDLISRYVSHNRLGMFGTWKDFPAFVGYITVWNRRNVFALEYDHEFFFLHISSYGRFDSTDKVLFLEWCEDVLLPWKRPILRDNRMWYWREHAIAALGLLASLGGDPRNVLEQHLARCDAGTYSDFLEAIREGFLDTDGFVKEDTIRKWFHDLQYAHDNQELPSHDFVDNAAIDHVCLALEDNAQRISGLTGT